MQGRHPSNNAPRTRLTPRQQNVRLYVPTLSEWCAAVARLGGSPHPAAVNEYATALKRVNSDAVAADVQAVLPRVAQIVQHTPGDKRKASMLDALGTSLQAHPPLLAAVAADAELCALLNWALGLAAADGETYTNALCTSQMATAQVKLGRFCAPFWRGLEQHGAQHLGPRQLATVVHRAAALRESDADGGLLQSGQGVCTVLCDALLQSSESLPEQAVANVLLAFPKLGWQLDGQLRDALLLAAGRTSARMKSQGVANTLWALAKLDVQPGAELQATLLDAAQRVSSGMNSQEVSNTIWALATLRVQPDALLQTSLLSAVQRVSSDMVAQNVSNTLWALATLRVQPDALLQTSLLSAVQRVSSDMVAQNVSNTIWALATLRVQPDALLQTSLLSAVQRVSSDMVAQNVSNTLWALATLRVQPGAEVQASLLGRAVRVSSDMVAQNVSNTLWALATMKVQPDAELQEALLGRAVHVNADTNPQHVANTLWALAELELQVEADTRAALCAALERAAPGMVAVEEAMTKSALQRMQWPVSDAVRRTLGMALRSEDTVANAR